MKKRILFINRMEPYTTGGARRVVWELGKYLARLGWDVHFFYASHRTDYPTIDGISFHRLPSPEGYFPSTYTFLLKGPKLFKKLLAKLNPDLVYDNTNPSPFIPAYLNAGEKLVVRIHHLARGDAFMLKSGIINPIATLFLEECFRLANNKHVIVDSESTLERMKSLVKRPKSLNIISPGIEPISSNHNDGAATSLVEKKKSQVLCICRMAKSKGIDYLLKAWKLVEAQNPTANLIIAGKGPQEEEFRHLLAELGLQRCKILGFIPDDVKEGLLLESEVYAFPTLIEGLPISLLEAMQYGLPIVTTSTWGAKDVVDNGINGLTVSPKTVEPLANALIELLNNKEMRTKMSLACGKMVKKYYLEEVLQKEASLLNSIYSQCRETEG